MRRMSVLVLSLGLVMATVGVGWAGVTDQASGAGHIGEGSNRRTFAFTAVQHADGTVTGEAQLFARAFPAKVHMKVTCLRVEGNTAYISGINTMADPEAFEGVWAIFGVQDNGEGKGAVDRITQFQQAADQGPNACLTESPSDWMDVEDGNIQVG